MAGIPPFNGGSTSNYLLGNGSTSTASNAQNPAELNAQSNTAQSNTTEQQFSSSMTTEERLKSSQSPLDNFLSDASQLASDTADAVTDLATDAYQGMKEINQEYALDQRAMGALKMLGGAGEAFVGSAGIMTPEPLTSVGGGILFVHGSDVASSGFHELLTGKPVETVTDQLATESAKLLGADDATARQFGDNVDMAIGLGSAGIGTYQALTRPVLAELGPMTIKSSAKVSGDVAESSGSAGKLQAAEGVSKTNAPEVTTTMRVGCNASSSTVNAGIDLSKLKPGESLPDNLEIVVRGSNNKPNDFILRQGVDDKAIGDVLIPGKSATIATDLTMKTEVSTMFGRVPTRGDTLSAGFVEDVRAAGFDVIYAPTAKNPRHVRIVSDTSIFNETGRKFLSEALDRVARQRK